MNALDKNLRSKLENTITRAREVAEEAAKSAIEQLGVEQPTPYVYLTVEERELRRKLRAHARQLGDELDQKTQRQEIERLTEEVAYEHWHRMLFARFLAENQLLMFFDSDDIDNAVAVSLDECEEMASEMGCSNGWELASRLATKMLPQIFRPESPVFELRLSPEKQKELEVLLAELEMDVFTASDSLGWVYQFWQTKKKEEVNAAGNKIGARELPAVTQLFTEPYMVSFLLDNSLGAWWAKKRLLKDDFKSAVSEEELRNKASLPGLPLEYLRFIKGEDGYWSPAGGTFEGWPEHLSKLKALDPCCGSGHFMVAAFSMLVPMRMELEGLSAREACDAILNDNIHGLEIDRRCVELAAFAVALTAWKYPSAGGFRKLPDLQIAWCGQSVNVKKEEWLALAEGDTVLKMHLEELYNLFKDAPVLGSLMNLVIGLDKESLFEIKWDDIKPFLIKGLKSKKDDAKVEMGVVARDLVKAAEILSQKYHLVSTNVPYLSRGKQSEVLAKFCSRFFPEAKSNLANTFVTRSLNLCNQDGYITIVTKDWQYQAYDKRFRTNLIKNSSIKILASIGTNGFSTPMYDQNIVLMVNGRKKVLEGYCFTGLDVTKNSGYDDKLSALIGEQLVTCNQFEQLKNPDARILLGPKSKEKLLSKYASYQQGICTGDLPRFIRKFWESYHCFDQWSFQQSTVSNNIEYGGREHILHWQNGSGDLYQFIVERLGEARVGSWIRGVNAWGKTGIAISSTGVISSTLYLGNLYDDSTMVLIPHHRKFLPAIWTYCSSIEFNKDVRCLDRKLNARSALVKVPFDYYKWNEVAKKDYPNGLPKPYSDDPTQWIFHAHPAHSEAPLQVAIARLLGYRWPAETDKDMDLSDEAKELVKKCDELLPYADKDGIVCIPPVRGEASAAERLLNLLAFSYKGQDINVIVSELLASYDHAGKSLDSWLREKFFAQHFKLFGHRPFIWHIWDGLHDGFAALVNYHKLDRKNLETLTYTYLGDWINKQKAEIMAGVDGAEEKLAAAENLKKSLELILEGEEPYDIFVRWKPLHLQAIGWEPDINDGVRMNIRPFLLVPDVGKKGAGILRDKPNIKWGKDRGKDTPSSPWYHQFGGNRINDHHLSLDEKKRAKEEKRERKQ